MHCAQAPSHFPLFVTPWAVAHQIPLSMGIFQAKILEWVAMPSSRGSSQPRDWPQVFHTAGGFFTTCGTREAQLTRQCLYLEKMSLCEEKTNLAKFCVWYSFRGWTFEVICHLTLHAKSLHLSLTLWEPMDRSLPGSSVQRISQARILEWIAMLFSRGSSWPRDCPR